VTRAAGREPDGPGPGFEVDATLNGFDDAQRLARSHRLVLAQHVPDPGVQCRVGIRDQGRCATR